MVSLKGEKAWQVSDVLPPDTYLFKPETVVRDQSRNGNEVIRVDWRVVAGNYQGAEKRDNVTVVEASVGRVVQLIEACDQQVPQEDFDSYAELADWVAKMLQDKRPLVEGIVREETYVVSAERRRGSDDSGERTGTKIAGYRKPSQSDLDNDTSGFKDVNVGNGQQKKIPF